MASSSSWQQAAERLSVRLMHPVVVVPEAELDVKTEFYRSQIKASVAQGYQRFVIIPLGNCPVHRLPIQSSFAWLRSQMVAQLYQSVAIHLAHAWSYDDWAELILDAAFDPPTKYEGSLEILSSRSAPSSILLVGNGYPAYAQELALLAFSVQQRAPELQVEYAFMESSYPSVQRVLNSRLQDVPSRLQIFPWRVDSETVDLETKTQLQQLAESETNQTALQILHLDFEKHPSVVHVLMSKYLSALYLRSSERYFCFTSPVPDLDSSLGESIADLDRRIDSMLPSEYQGRTDDVKPTSMGSASLKMDSMGKVAWDEIWTSFCDLAMAGGPPHRGKLLEAISGEAAESKPDAYHQVVQEIQRGITMVTGLKTAESAAKGWVGVECDDDLMASWLLRAIIVENIMVRREKNILFVPAGPDFSIQREIKNVITSVAKTVHYWRAHLRTRDQ